MNNNASKKPIAISIIAAFLLLLSYIGFHLFTVTVEAGHVGILRTAGKVVGGPLSPGLHPAWPWQTCTQMDTRVLTVDHSVGDGFSSDSQSTSSVVSVTFRIKPEKAVALFQGAGNVESVKKSIIEVAIPANVKAAISGFTAPELVSNRDEVKKITREKIQESVEKAVASKGASGAIDIIAVAIIDFSFSSTFNKAVDEKVKSLQEAQKAKHLKDKTETEAEAKKTVDQLLNDADNYAVNQLSIAKSQANKLEADALSAYPEVVELRKIETWDGKLPTYNGVVPLIQQQQTVEQQQK